MNTMTIANTGMNNNIFSIVKSGQKHMKQQSTVFNVIKTTKAELIRSLSEFRTDREEIIMEMTAVQVQLHLAHEQRIYLDAVIERDLKDKVALEKEIADLTEALEFKRSVNAWKEVEKTQKALQEKESELKFRETAYWKTYKAKGKLMKKVIEPLYAEKRMLAGKLQTIDGLRLGIRAILADPEKLRQAAAEPVLMAA